MRRNGRCATAEVDLDALADGYRFRPTSPVALARAAAAAASLPGNAVVLDIGGGPGAHAAVFARHGHRAIVVDPAITMHQHARQGEARRVAAVAQRLPFRSDSVDLAYFHLSIHYGDLAATIAEASRVLRVGGRVQIWTMTPDYHRRSYLAHWFPSVADIDAQRFPTSAAIVDLLERHGFVGVAAEVQNERKQMAAHDWITAVRAGFVSTLQLVAPEEIEAGLAEFSRKHSGDEISYVLEYTGIGATFDAP